MAAAAEAEAAEVEVEEAAAAAAAAAAESTRCGAPVFEFAVRVSVGSPGAAIVSRRTAVASVPNAPTDE